MNKKSGMRFAILLLISMLISAVASATEAAPLRIGYERPALPDVTSYYGETGVSIQALRFRDAEALKDGIFPYSMSLDSQDKADLYVRWRDYLYRSISAGLPRAQMILIVRDQLPSIIQSYRENRSGAYPQFFKLVHESIVGKERSLLSDYNVFFDYDTKGVFRVDGVEPNRLAVNTGSAVHFNLKDIMKKESFTVADAVQLWLHEILHAEKSESLEVRDKWGADVAQFVQENTKEIRLDSERRIISLKSQSQSILKDRLSQNYPYEDLKESIKNGFLIFEQTPQGSRVMTEVYDGFVRFNSGLGWQQDSYGFQKSIQVPEIIVTGVKAASDQSVRVDYSQSLRAFHMENGFYQKGSTIGSTDQFRIELTTGLQSVETSHSYSSPLQDGDFEIVKVKDVRDKRYLSIRVNLESINTFLDASSKHLIAKDLTTSEVLSYEIKQVHLLGPQEALIDVEVAQKNIELSYITYPAKDLKKYREISLRPSMKMVLSGPDQERPASLQVKSVSISEKQTQTDALLLKIKTADTKRITGIAIELEHIMLAQNFSYVNSRPRSEAHGYLGLGRKYFISQKQLQISADGISAVLPEIDMTRYELGPQMSQRLSRSYEKRWQDQLPVLQDNRQRRIISISVYFEDGHVEKIPKGSLPSQAFSFVSAQELQASRIQAEKNARRLLGLDEAPVQEIISCGKVF